MKKLSLILTTFILFAATPVFAETSSDDPFGTKKVEVTGAIHGEMASTVVQFINYFLGFLGLLAVTMIIYAGVLFVTAQGDDQQLNKAKKVILWAVVGILIIMLSFVIVNMITGARNFIQ